MPTREELWARNICANDGSARVKRQQTPQPRGVASPLLVPVDGSHTYDSLFLASGGQLSAFGPDGSAKWNLQTQATWRVDSEKDWASGSTEVQTEREQFMVRARWGVAQLSHGRPSSRHACASWLNLPFSCVVAGDAFAIAAPRVSGAWPTC